MDETVLLVEDDHAISEITARGLKQSGFGVDVETDGRRAVGAFRAGDFDVVVLDVMLPSLDGFEVCRQIRRDSPVPIIMLTARNDTADVVLGLEAGADDYVTKPFEMRELVARVRALLRRVRHTPSDDVIRLGPLEVDVPGHKTTVDSSPVNLTATEFKLLVTLARHAGQVMTREMLLELVWEYDYLGDSRVVDMAIKRLREKVERDPSNPQLIETVRGVGYRIDRR
ncbi:MAG: response regulator transcription factor [Actinomycetota bacterium]|nr:response regulator transcription factor [Actinomycetota bacterium]